MKFTAFDRPARGGTSLKMNIPPSSPIAEGLILAAADAAVAMEEFWGDVGEAFARVTVA